MPETNVDVQVVATEQEGQSVIDDLDLEVVEHIESMLVRPVRHIRRG